MSIHKDTSIIPIAVAESIVEDVQRVTGLSLKDHRAVEAYLANHAEEVYRHNVTFKRKVRSNADHGSAGLNYLYDYMQHWLASWLKKHDAKFYRELPRGFGWGR